MRLVILARIILAYFDSEEKIDARYPTYLKFNTCELIKEVAPKIQHFISSPPAVLHCFFPCSLLFMVMKDN